MMTRNIAKRGFDMQLAAGYQVWGGLLTPIVLPLVVLVADLFFATDMCVWLRSRCRRRHCDSPEKID